MGLFIVSLALVCFLAHVWPEIGSSASPYGVLTPMMMGSDSVSGSVTVEKVPSATCTKMTDMRYI